MRKAGRAGLLVVLAMSLVAESAAAQTKVDLQLLPGKMITGAQVGQLVVTIQGTGGTGSASLSIEPPPGFKTEPQSLQLLGPLPHTRTILVQRVDSAVPSGQRTILAHYRDTPTSATGRIDFVHENVTVGTLSYLILGMVGVVFGYAIKMILKVFTALPVPQIALFALKDGTETRAEGPITKFVRDHYYTVDLGLTIAIGFLVLLSNLTESGPAAGTRWSAAVLLGAGIGVLANNDLLARLSPRR